MASWLMPPISRDVQADDTTAVYWRFTDWIPASTVKQVKAVLRLRQSTLADVTVTPAYQTAQKRTDEPDDWADLDGTTVSSENDQACTGIVDMTAKTDWDERFYIRFGVKCENTTGSGTDTQFADVTLIVSGRD